MDVSFTTSEAFSTKYLFAKMPTTADTVDLADTNTHEIVGISQRTALSGEEVAIRTSGFSLITLGESGVVAGTKLRPGTGGKAYIADTVGDMVVAIAIDNGSDGEQVPCILVPNTPYAYFGATGTDEVTQVAEVTITTAEVLALNTTEKTLVSAPWAGKAIIVDKIITSVDYNSAAYATNTDMEFRYTDKTGTKVSADITSLLDATADKVVTAWGIEAQLVPVVNAPVVANVATGDPVTGDSDVKVTVVYRVVSI